MLGLGRKVLGKSQEEKKISVNDVVVVDWGNVAQKRWEYTVIDTEGFLDKLIG